MSDRKNSDRTKELLIIAYDQSFSLFMEIMKKQHGLIRLVHFPVRWYVNRLRTRILIRDSKR
jgi:calcineurin-like phosphoesterase family protein